MGKIMESNRSLELVIGLSGWRNMLRKIPFSVVDHLGNFDDLIQNGFWVIPKIAFANLWKPIHGFINIAVLPDLLNLETESEGKNTKNWISREQKGLFR